MYIVIVISAVFMEGFFSGSEIAFISADIQKMKEAIRKENKNKNALFFKNNPKNLLNTTLVGTNFSAVFASTLASMILIQKFPNYSTIITSIVVIPFILLFGEIIPKIVYQNNAMKIIFVVTPFLRFFYFLFKPISLVITLITSKVIKKMENEFNEYPEFTKEELEQMVDEQGDGTAIPENERLMLKRVFDFYQRDASDIMVPLVDVFALDEKELLNDTLPKIIHNSFSRVPLFKKRVDNISGVLYAHDVLRSKKDMRISLSELKRAAFFVPENMPIQELLFLMREKKISIVFIVDEYGGILGIATLEDVIEEIFGEIADEYDERSEFFKKIEEKKYLINGRMEIDQINEILHFEIPEGDYETLAGFLLNEFKYIPRVGETFDFENISFKIYKADDRTIEDVMVILK